MNAQFDVSSSPSSAPASAGFAALLREARRRRRCSQLELSLLAGVSQRHLSFLESGRAKPSRTMLLQLAEALALNLERRNVWLVAAGYAPVYARRALTAPDMAPVRMALTRMLEHHEPYPAFVIDREWNRVLANRPADHLVELLGDPHEVWATICGDGPRNMVKLALHPRGLRPFIVNIDEVAAEVLGRLRLEAVDHPPVAALLQEVLAYPGIPARWVRMEPPPAPAPVLATHLKAGALELRLFAMFTTFGTPQDQTADELRVETLYPADAASEQALRALAGPAIAPRATP